MELGVSSTAEEATETVLCGACLNVNTVPCGLTKFDCPQCGGTVYNCVWRDDDLSPARRRPTRRAGAPSNASMAPQMQAFIGEDDEDDDVLFDPCRHIQAALAGTLRTTQGLLGRVLSRGPVSSDSRLGPPVSPPSSARAVIAQPPGLPSPLPPPTLLPPSKATEATACSGCSSGPKTVVEELEDLCLSSPEASPSSAVATTATLHGVEEAPSDCQGVQEALHGGSAPDLSFVVGMPLSDEAAAEAGKAALGLPSSPSVAGQGVVCDVRSDPQLLGRSDAVETPA